MSRDPRFILWQQPLVRRALRSVKLIVIVQQFQGWKVRLWLGLQLIRLAAWVAGVGVEFRRDG